MDRNKLRKLLAEQHKWTRYDAIDEVTSTFADMQVLHDQGELSFTRIRNMMMRLEKKIMNLKQLSPTGFKHK